MTPQVRQSGAAIRDFPFYDGHPIALSPGRWLLVLATVAVGFAALMGGAALVPGRAGGWLGVLAFAALPLGGLALAAGRHWKTLIAPPNGRDLLIGLAFAPLTMIVSATAAVLVMRVSLTSANPVVAMLAHLKGGGLALFLASTLPQLFGEELVTILPFLALLTGLRQGLKLSRRTAIVVAWVGSAILFALLHLSTYGWRLGQVLAVIGTARLMLTLPYLITKSIWSSTIAHVTHDWVLFAVVLAALAAR